MLSLWGKAVGLHADTFTLYLKTHNFHWNVVGPMFHTLHLMFGEQYNELWLAADVITKRIRALGCHVPGSYREFSKLTYLRAPEIVPSAADMIADLLRHHDTCARTAGWALALARTVVDAPTENLVAHRLMAHQKAPGWGRESKLATAPYLRPRNKVWHCRLLQIRASHIAWVWLSREP